MTCRFGTNVVVCGPPPGVYRRTIRSCPVCERRHRFIVRWDGVWYGTTLYGSCGDSWQDGELGYRPFEKGWRKKAQARFREMWNHAAPPELYEAYIQADIRFNMTDGEDWTAACDERERVQRQIIERQSA